MPADAADPAEAAGRRCPIGPVALGALALFAVVAAVARTPLLILGLNGPSALMTVGVLILYAPAGVAALLRPRPTQTDWLIVGSLALTLAFLASRIVSILMRDFGLVWIVDSDLLALRIALSLFGMGCLLVAPFAGAATAVRRWRWSLLWAVLGLLAAAGLLAMHGGHPPPLLRAAAQGRG